MFHPDDDFPPPCLGDYADVLEPPLPLHQEVVPSQPQAIVPSSTVPSLPTEPPLAPPSPQEPPESSQLISPPDASMGYPGGPNQPYSLCYQLFTYTDPHN